MCFDGDFDTNDFDATTWVRARKSHDCCACNDGIKRGDMYHRTATCYDGRVTTWKHCARCYAICKALWAAGAEMIEMELNCGESWEHHWGELPPEVAALAFITPAEAQTKLVPSPELR
jgi:hypothetical protein